MNFIPRASLFVHEILFLFSIYLPNGVFQRILLQFYRQLKWLPSHDSSHYRLTNKIHHCHLEHCTFGDGGGDICGGDDGDDGDDDGGDDGDDDDGDDDGDDRADNYGDEENSQECIRGYSML